MANISQIKLPNGDTYDLKDNGALQLTGGQVTGPVTFGDSVSIDELTTGDLVVNGAGSFTNNLQVNTINGITVGDSPKFTDTVTTINTTGSGNAITAITASNGVLTATKGATFLTSYTETDPTVPAWAKASSKPSYSLTEISGTDDLRAIEGLTGTTGLLKKTAANTWTLDTNTYLTSYTETDPVFGASVAAGITSSDISNWNSKTSNTGTITSVKTTAGQHTTINVTSGAANFNVPTNTSHLTNDSGFLTLATLPIYNGTVE